MSPTPAPGAGRSPQQPERWLRDPAWILFASLAVLTAVLIAVTITAILSIDRINQSAKQKFVDEALPTTTQVQDLLLSLVNEETGVRGYIVSGDPRSLGPYTEGRRNAQRDLAALQRFAERHPAFRAPLQTARTQIGAIDEYFAQEIDLVRSGFPGMLRAQLRVDEGRVLFSRFRTTAQLIQARAAEFIASAERGQSRTFRTQSTVLILLGSIGVLLSVTLLVLGPKRVRRLNVELERGARAALALDHVDDAVILVDGSGTVLYANATGRGMFPSGDAVDSPPLLPAFDGPRERIEKALAGGSHEVTIPLETDIERWLSVAVVEFDRGMVYRIRDVTGDHELERLRSDFVATASHELRTPVASVYGAAETLLRTDVTLDESTKDQLLRVIREESRSLAQIIEQILLAGELDRGRVDVVDRDVRVVPLAEAVVEAAIRRAPPETRLELHTELDRSFAVSTDETRLRQVLVNLVENAIKYSPGGGTVAVHLTAADGEITLGVSDEGIGISNLDRERIFEKFYRVDAAMAHGIGGTGLGLYIVRELVHRLGGEIEMNSSPGEGSTFTVRLPLGRTAEHE